LVGTQEAPVAVVGIRELSRDTSRVIKEFERTGEPVVLTREGKPIGALVRVDQTRLEALALSSVPEIAAARREAIQADDEGRIRSLDDVAREHGVEPPAREKSEYAFRGLRARPGPGGSLLPPLARIFDETHRSRLQAQAEDAVGRLTESATRVVDEGLDTDELLLLTSKVYARYLAVSLNETLQESDDPDAAIAAAIERAATNVESVTHSLSEEDRVSMREYRAALLGFAVGTGSRASSAHSRASIIR
jgi:prevent-host-death family protein